MDRLLELVYASLLQQAVDHPRILIVGAVASPLLPELQQQCELVLVQYDRVLSNELTQLGVQTLHQSVPDEKEMDLALVLPTKNRVRTKGDIAQAMMCLKHGGALMMGCPNSMGSRGYQQALQQITPNLQVQSKAKARLFRVFADDVLDRGLLAEWQMQGQQQKLEALTLYSRPGVFSWDRLDVGTSLLLDVLSKGYFDKISGRGMDLCCGNGVLAVRLLEARGDVISELHLVDSDWHGLMCAKRNLQGFSGQGKFHWLDATTEALPSSLDWLVCNPPFHQGQQQDIGLGQQILHKACTALKRGGTILVVANRNLPYEQLMRDELSESGQVVAANGFKVLWGRR